jgi:hypothetical protein
MAKANSIFASWNELELNDGFNSLKVLYQSIHRFAIDNLDGI